MLGTKSANRGLADSLRQKKDTVRRVIAPTGR
jgi:hypothetical protein